MSESMPPAGNTPGVNSGNHTPGVKEAGVQHSTQTEPVVVHDPRFRFWALVALGLVLAGLAGWFWLTQRSASIPTIPLADEALTLDLRGLDEPQAINGTCVKSFTVHGIRGDERFNDQKFALSIQLVGNPADEASLTQLLSSVTCAEELKTIEGTVKTKLGLEKSTAEQFTTSYVTKSGRRLFLP